MLPNSAKPLFSFFISLFFSVSSSTFESRHLLFYRRFSSPFLLFPSLFFFFADAVVCKQLKSIPYSFRNFVAVVCPGQIGPLVLCNPGSVVFKGSENRECVQKDTIPNSCSCSNHVIIVVVKIVPGHLHNRIAKCTKDLGTNSTRINVWALSQNALKYQYQHQEDSQQPVSQSPDCIARSILYSSTFQRPHSSQWKQDLVKNKARIDLLVQTTYKQDLQRPEMELE